MIPSSPFAKAGAGGLALVVVGVLVGTQFTAAEVRVEGGGQPVEASLGASFADLATTAAVPDRAPPTVTPDAPEPIRPTPQQESPVVSAPEPDVAMPVTPPTMSSTPTVPVATRPEENETKIAAEPAPQPDVITNSPRPTERPERPTARTPPETQKADDGERVETTPTARAGSETGRRDAPAARAGRSAPRVEPTGNAAASNYPGEVMQRISRQRKPSVRARGTAKVAFQVAAAGGLSSVGIARSSGSDALDGAAVDLIRRAAPFPPPPPGARRSFSIQISGR